MRESRVRSAPEIAKINVTPIIDVALVLVIILLVTAPMMSMSDLPLDLPDAHVRDTERPVFISLTMAADGRLAIDDAALGGFDEVAPRLRARLAQRRGDRLLVVVRADASLPPGVVKRMMDAARDGGAVNLGIATSQIGGATP
jgi:biopolymer transport protein ExbD